MEVETLYGSVYLLLSTSRRELGRFLAFAFFVDLRTGGGGGRGRMLSTSFVEMEGASRGSVSVKSIAAVLAARICSGWLVGDTGGETGGEDDEEEQPI